MLTEKIVMLFDIKLSKYELKHISKHYRLMFSPSLGINQSKKTFTAKNVSWTCLKFTVKTTQVSRLLDKKMKKKALTFFNKKMHITHRLSCQSFKLKSFI